MRFTIIYCFCHSLLRARPMYEHWLFRPTLVLVNKNILWHRLAINVICVVVLFAFQPLYTRQIILRNANKKIRFDYLLSCRYFHILKSVLDEANAFDHYISCNTFPNSFLLSTLTLNTCQVWTESILFEEVFHITNFWKHSI